MRPPSREGTRPWLFQYAWHLGPGRAAARPEDTSKVTKWRYRPVDLAVFSAPSSVRSGLYGGCILLSV